MAKKWYKQKYKRYKKVRRKKKNRDLEMFLVIFAIVLVYGIVTNIENILKATAPFLIALLVIVITVFILRKKYILKKEKEELKRKFSLDELLSMYKERPTDFEHYIAKVYRGLGYKTEVTPASNDGGKDIIMHKKGQKYVVEVKLYSHHNWINREQMQKLHSVVVDEKAKGIFVTTSSFKTTAIEWAKKCNIELVDGKKLVQIINSASC